MNAKQRRRLQRKKKLKDSEKRQSDALKGVDNVSLNSEMKKETDALCLQLADLGLKQKSVPGDGNCLYHAILHQLDDELTVEELRKITAEELRSNRSDYEPFFAPEIFPDIDQNQNGYDSYCGAVENTTCWAGHLEISALANHLRRPIHVIQSDSPSICVQGHCEENPIYVVYQKHLYELGEHYDSVEKVEAS